MSDGKVGWFPRSCRARGIHWPHQYVSALELAFAKTDPIRDRAPVQDTKPASLNIKVKSQDGNEVYFKVKKTTPFRRIMEAYCSKVGVETGQVRFLFDGERIEASQTPESLDLEDEDTIDAMVQQLGGCC